MTSSSTRVSGASQSFLNFPVVQMLLILFCLLVLFPYLPIIIIIIIISSSSNARTPVVTDVVYLSPFFLFSSSSPSPHPYSILSRPSLSPSPSFLLFRCARNILQSLLPAGPVHSLSSLFLVVFLFVNPPTSHKRTRGRLLFIPPLRPPVIAYVRLLPSAV